MLESAKLMPIWCGPAGLLDFYTTCAVRERSETATYSNLGLIRVSVSQAYATLV